MYFFCAVEVQWQVYITIGHIWNKTNITYL